MTEENKQETLSENIIHLFYNASYAYNNEKSREGHRCSRQHSGNAHSNERIRSGMAKSYA